MAGVTLVGFGALAVVSSAHALKNHDDLIVLLIFLAAVGLLLAAAIFTYWAVRPSELEMGFRVFNSLRLLALASSTSLITLIATSVIVILSEDTWLAVSRIPWLTIALIGITGAALAVLIEARIYENRLRSTDWRGAVSRLFIPVIVLGLGVFVFVIMGTLLVSEETAISWLHIDVDGVGGCYGTLRYRPCDEITSAYTQALLKISTLLASVGSVAASCRVVGPATRPESGTVSRAECPQPVPLTRTNRPKPGGPLPRWA